MNNYAALPPPPTPFTIYFHLRLEIFPGFTKNKKNAPEKGWID